MIKALFTASTGLNAQSTSIDTVANNLANVNTNGFKRNHLDFQDLIYVNEVSPGAAQGQDPPSGLQVGSGVRVAGTPKIFTQGSLITTGNNYDLAIEGQGFLQVSLPNGSTAYTRDGALRINSQGSLVTSDGFPIQPQLNVSSDILSISVAPDGTISGTNATGAKSNVGQLTLVRFSNPAGLSAEGRNLFTETASSGSPITGTPGQNGTGLLRQGVLERSNVEAVTELVNLILAQRAFEFNTRSIQSADQMLSRISQMNV
ncbi:MAG: flagellar basal-body rod protein FlgG [Gemmataceae bacterium]|nr:flagellar basal-body rod protein FlgG [Gemmataceae bacterium]